MTREAIHQVERMQALSLEPVHEDLFRSLFTGYSSYVAASLSRLGVPARDRDDLVAEVFVRVCRALHAFDPSRSPKPWLFAFAIRVASEHRRLARNRHEVLHEETEHKDEAASAESLLEQKDARVLVEKALATLDMEKRTVFILHDLDEVPVPEIATGLGIAEGTAYSRLRAARAEFTAAVRREQLAGQRRGS